jgi:hypothetical protein
MIDGVCSSPGACVPPEPPPPPPPPPHPLSPPEKLLAPGMIWQMVGEVELSTYNTYQVIDPDIAHPDDLEGERHARLQGAVILNGKVWKYSDGHWRQLKRNRCADVGGVPIVLGCTHSPYVDSDDENIIFATGAVSVEEDSWFKQGETPIYVTYGDPRKALVIAPLDGCSGCEPSGIDVYAGYSTDRKSRWGYGPFKKPTLLWRQIPIPAPWPPEDVL